MRSSGLGVGVAGCALLLLASCSRGTSSGTDRLHGEYRATSAGSISTLTFVDSTRYWLVPSGSCSDKARGCVRSGTYALANGDRSIVLTDGETGQATTYPFSPTTTSNSTVSESTHPLAGSLPPPTIAGPTSLLGSGTSLVTGFKLDLVSFQMAGCGTCPEGFTCGSANGTSVCFSATGIPRFSNVVVIMMENTTLSTLEAAGNTPYLSSLATNWATSSNYHGATHPSLRNYIALTSGDPQGIGSDNILNQTFCDCHPTGNACSAFNCVVAGIPIGNCGCPIAARNLADDLEMAGLTWHDYGEGMGTPCNVTDDSSVSYAARHIPFIYYDDIRTTGRCAAKSSWDYSSFAGDLERQPVELLAHRAKPSCTTCTTPFQREPRTMPMETTGCRRRYRRSSRRLLGNQEERACSWSSGTRTTSPVD